MPRPYLQRLATQNDETLGAAHEELLELVEEHVFETVAMCIDLHTHADAVDGGLDQHALVGVAPNLQRSQQKLLASTGAHNNKSNISIATSHSWPQPLAYRVSTSGWLCLSTFCDGWVRRHNAASSEVRTHCKKGSNVFAWEQRHTSSR